MKKQMLIASASMLALMIGLGATVAQAADIYDAEFTSIKSNLHNDYLREGMEALAADTKSSADARLVVDEMRQAALKRAQIQQFYMERVIKLVGLLRAQLEVERREAADAAALALREAAERSAARKEENVLIEEVLKNEVAQVATETNDFVPSIAEKAAGLESSLIGEVAGERADLIVSVAQEQGLAAAPCLDDGTGGPGCPNGPIRKPSAYPDDLIAEDGLATLTEESADRISVAGGIKQSAVQNTDRIADLIIYDPDSRLVERLAAGPDIEQIFMHLAESGMDPAQMKEVLGHLLLAGEGGALERRVPGREAYPGDLLAEDGLATLTEESADRISVAGGIKHPAQVMDSGEYEATPFYDERIAFKGVTLPEPAALQAEEATADVLIGRANGFLHSLGGEVVRSAEREVIAQLEDSADLIERKAHLVEFDSVALQPEREMISEIAMIKLFPGPEEIVPEGAVMKYYEHASGGGGSFCNGGPDTYCIMEQAAGGGKDQLTREYLTEASFSEYPSDGLVAEGGLMMPIMAPPSVLQTAIDNVGKETLAEALASPAGEKLLPYTGSHYCNQGHDTCMYLSAEAEDSIILAREDAAANVSMIEEDDLHHPIDPLFELHPGNFEGAAADAASMAADLPAAASATAEAVLGDRGIIDICNTVVCGPDGKPETGGEVELMEERVKHNVQQLEEEIHQIGIEQLREAEVILSLEEAM